MKTILVCFDVPCSKLENGTAASQWVESGDLTLEVSALNAQVLQGIRNDIFRRTVAGHVAHPGVTVRNPIFKSICVLDESLIVRTR